MQECSIPIAERSGDTAVLHWAMDMQNLVPEAGGHLNKKDGLTRYGDSHVKDKTS